jgi:hypothetical protein
MAQAIDKQIKSPQLVAFPEALTWEQLGKKLSSNISSVK